MTRDTYRLRRTVLVLFMVPCLAFFIFTSGNMWRLESTKVTKEDSKEKASVVLELLEVKGKASKSNYERSAFGDGWLTTDGCDMRNIILHRDLDNTVVNSNCKVISGLLKDPYTGKIISFKQGANSSKDIQIDHVVALSDAWQKGAQELSRQRRIEFANDPLELLAVDGAANQQKGDGDAATWLPKNKAFRCEYVSRQIAVKHKYGLWLSRAEKDAIKRVLLSCPDQILPTP